MYNDLLEYVKSDAVSTEELQIKLLELKETLENRLKFFQDLFFVEPEHASYLILAFDNGWLTPQFDSEGRMHLNPQGAVSREEVVNALSLNENTLNYSDSDLGLNIRRFELAYLLANCDRFSFGKDIVLAQLLEDLYQFEDMLKIPLITGMTIENFLPKGVKSVEDYIQGVKTGRYKFPLLLSAVTGSLMLLVKDKVDLTELRPLMGVSRLEFAFIMNIIEKLQ